jgi:two-component system, response regulator YesN
MVVLIVDDQTSVVSGIVTSIDWNRIGVTKVLKAYTAFEAKDIFNIHAIDVMLCDIEMPVEDGLSLLRWVKAEGYSTECIFLTAHADFMYAKEAVHLGSFDYIVQPAWSEDIQNALVRAIIRVKSKQEHQKYYSYGKLWSEKEDSLLDGILKDWFLGKQVNVNHLMDDLKKIHITIDLHTKFYFTTINVIRWGNSTENWNESLFRYALTNMVSEIFNNYGQKIILIQLDSKNFAFLIYSEENAVMDILAVERQLNYLINVCKDYFQCSIACYTGESLQINELTGRIRELVQLRENNVALISKVFLVGEESVKKRDNYHILFMERWTDLLVDGFAQIVKEEANHYLDSQAEKGMLDAEDLQRFYQAFLHVLFKTLEKLNISMKDIFNDHDTLKKSLSLYNSIDEMKELIDYVVSYFERRIISHESTDNQIRKIIQYIHDHIESDIRRTHIAQTVFLSPDYISRLFKQEVGMSLSEFVMTEKMKVAHTLLRTTSLPINMVAIKVGYSNFSYFSKIYKKIMGTNPVTSRQNK